MNLERRLSPLLPPWAGWKTQAAQWAAVSAVVFLVCGSLFGEHFLRALRELYYFSSYKTLIPGRTVPPFPRLFHPTLWVVPVAAALALLDALKHYLGYFQGSRSIYLMRRLPQRWELARRCLVFPLAGLSASLTAYALTALFCLIWYWVQTPAGCLPPDIWAGIGG